MCSRFKQTQTNREQGIRRMIVVAVLALFAWSSLSYAGDAPKKPKEEDSPSRFKPPQAHFKASVKPSEAKPGETVEYKVHVTLDANWHIYKLSRKQAESGPRLTLFDFFDPAGLKLEGDWKPDRDPIKEKDPSFPDLASVEFYQDEVDWTIKLKVPADAEPGKKTLRCQAYYQICRSGKNGTCSIPGGWTLPHAVVTVVAGEGKPVAAAATAPNEVVEQTPAQPAVEQTPTKPADPPASVTTENLEKKESKQSIPSVLAADSSPAKTDLEKTIEAGPVPFLLLSAGAGLLALVMPCVWPMVPITVNFFVKQGQAKNGKTLGLAITYCLSIIVIFTALGVFVSLIFGASSLQRLATTAWLNGLVALLFVVFGLSLLGFFEIGLPSFLLNASAKQEGRGGLVGVFFMATTLTITSFTCTFPVVGGLLVMASTGKYFYPIIGLATFSTVLALPFFVLALAPGLLAKVPKSGDWMNAVKVVGGLVELGAAFKFINNVEIVYVNPSDAWFGAYTVLTIWIVLSLICGIYLLGLFRTNHDYDAVKVGPGRMLAGALFIGIALFLAPALFGKPPATKVWDRLIVGLLPPDVGTLKTKTAIVSGSGSEASEIETKASSRDPKVAITQQKSFHGVVWGFSYDLALERAKREGKPVLIDFTGVWCANCRQMEEAVMPRPEVVDRLKRFVTVQLYTDKVPIDSIDSKFQFSLARTNADFLLEFLKDVANPLYVILTPDGKLVAKKAGYIEPNVFVEFLDQGLTKFENTGEKVARLGQNAP